MLEGTQVSLWPVNRTIQHSGPFTSKLSCEKKKLLLHVRQWYRWDSVAAASSEIIPTPVSPEIHLPAVSMCQSFSSHWTRSSRARTSSYSVLHLSLASMSCSIDSGIYLSLSTFTTNNKVTPVTHHLCCLKMLQKYQHSLWLKLSNSTTILRTMPTVKGLSCIVPLPTLIASQFQRGVLTLITVHPPQHRTYSNTHVAFLGHTSPYSTL